MRSGRRRLIHGNGEALLIAATPSDGVVEMTAHSFDNCTLIQRSNNSPGDDLATAIQRSVPVLVEMVEDNDNLIGIAEVVPICPV
jgi:hypothetical protein